MEREKFLNKNFSYEEAKTEIAPIIRHFFGEDEQLLEFKITSLNEQSFSVMAISTEWNVWRMDYRLMAPERWERNPIQSSARLDRSEIIALRENFAEDEICMRFYREALNYEGKAD